ncbi:DMT family transporter [Oceanicoccus sp. KOV_DT_Chl]|uniref:DMT family transporter n=1 Tax=Oceanicoccus sp. KOV_DT_Chl TaxID=1904639 RepID=UPI000C7CF10B|nr:DMT family transporter [Oceanicoccus sp. KOV_DT_Chl]
MLTKLAYLLALVIWSTTPLAIKLSNDSVTPIAAILLRTLLAVALGSLIIAISRRSEVLRPRYFKIYLAGSIGIFPNLVLIYYAAELISSGLIAVIMGLAPFVTSVVAYFLLGGSLFTVQKTIAQIIAIAGLITIYYGQIVVDNSSGIGIGLVLCSTLLFSLSAVLVKRFGAEQSMSPLNQTVGSMVFSIPGLLLGWWLLDGNIHLVFSPTSVIAIGYLAIVGSLLGFVTFFYVLKRVSVGLVSLILLITPVGALMIGKFVAGEQLTTTALIGSALILLGLFLYENMFSLLLKRNNRH